MSIETIHDYYLKQLLEPEPDDYVEFNKWKTANKKRLKDKSEEEKRIIWQEEVIGKKKKEILNRIKNEKNIREIYPDANDLQNLPKNSVLIKISFTLKKPYLSKDEGEFHILNGRIFENPIVRDKFTGLPMVRPSTWKGHLRFSTEKIELYDEEKKKRIIKRLFGSESEDETALKGRLYFFPTFFERDAGKDVITPLRRDTRTPARGLIPIEVVKSGSKGELKSGSKGEFYLLYIPYPKGKDFKEEQIKEDLKFLAEALKLMFYLYGFSAKKTSGFGVIEDLRESDIEIYPEDKKEVFSILYTKGNRDVNYGASK